jgi:hypothetical protein
MNGHNESGLLDRRFETLCLCFFCPPLLVSSLLIKSNSLGSSSHSATTCFGKQRQKINASRSVELKSSKECGVEVFAWTLVQNKL